MTQLLSAFLPRCRFIGAMLVAIVAGCGGGSLDPILGTPAVTLVGTPPVVTGTSPAATTPPVTGVALNTRVSATFSKSMAPATLTSVSFTLSCPSSAPITGAVTYDAASLTATFAPTAPLPPSTLCVATVSGAVTDSTGLPMAADFVWRFNTGPAGTVPPTVTPPVVTATVPAAAIPPVAGVALNTKVSATFSKSMAPATFTNASFMLACPSASALTGGVTYDAASRTATFTPSAPLPPNTLCVATISGAVTDSTGVALAADFVWRFSTGAAADVTPPTVTLTVPADTATGVATNTLVSATFSENMAPATLSATSFTLQNATLATAVAGTVSYSGAAHTATFTPTAGPLPNSTRFTGTITTAVTDLAGNVLASNFVWSFTTGAAADLTSPTVTTVTPPDGTTGLCLSKTVTATFSKSMDPATLNTTTFFVSNGPVGIPGTVAYDAVNKVATFTVSGAAGFPPNASLSATVLGGTPGVKDLSGNSLASDRTWTFATGSQPCAAGVDLGSAALFGSFGGGAGMTNEGINTVIQGRIGTTAACTLITGFHDATDVYTETPLNVGLVSGGVFCAPPAPGTAVSAATATQARADALTAYNALAAMPAGGDPGAGQLGGLVLAPGVYTSAGGTFGVTNGDLTLDAQGDPNAVWVFQMAASLTVGAPAIPRNVLLVNGGQAKNVYWQVGSAGRIEDRSVMVGTIIAPAGVTISTAGQTAQTTLTGRALGLTASVTVVNTTIVAP